MKTGLAIVNAYFILPGVEHFYKRMKEELAKRGVSLSLATNAEIMASISSTGDILSSCGKYDFILYLDKDIYVSKMLSRSGIKMFDSADSIALCDDKMLTHIELADDGIKMPKTISGPLNYSKDDNQSFVNNLEKLLAYPFIAKENFGSLGREVFMINSHEELAAFEKEHGHNPRLFQEYISSSKGHDYRLIVIGGHCAAGMKRVNDKGDFRSNIALGGHGEKIAMPKAYISLAEKAARKLKLAYCGVDLLEGPKGEPILDEVNSNAFIDGIEKVTGANVAGVYADYIVKQIN